MADPASLRFTPQNKTTNERLSTQTVGLVALSDFRKRRAEVLEQQEREAREAQLASSATNTPPDRSLTGTPNNASETSEAEKQARRKKKKKLKPSAANKLSFGGADDEEEDLTPSLAKGKTCPSTDANGDDTSPVTNSQKPSNKFAANKSVSVVPRSLTKSALRREAAEREALRKEFLLLQAAVKATEIAVPFVFYDGANTPGGTVRIRKGDFVWFFLDKSRKVGAELAIGGDKTANARKQWARVGVDDLLLVRGTIIIPHHYEFYFFVMNKTVGPGNIPLFEYSADAPSASEAEDDPSGDSLSNQSNGPVRSIPHIRTLEGANDDPSFTKVVDRRWYERNKHIYPASAWQEFDPEKDYKSEVRRDLGGNAFFYSGDR